MTQIATPLQLRAAFWRWALFCVPGILLLGFLSGQLAGSGPGNPWFASLVKPSIYPPPQLFGIVWTLLYILMGFAIAMIAAARGADRRWMAVGLFVVQLALNLAWSPMFFGARQITASLVLIIALDAVVLLTVIVFFRIRQLAGVFLLPYLAWILFATYLTYEFRNANPGADGRVGGEAVTRFEL